MMAGEKILVVDDEKAMRNLCYQILDEEGYEVSLAEDGKEAVNKVLREDFAVAIVDIKMPGMDGMEVLRFIKKHKSHTEVIMITGYGTIKTAVEAMKLGAADYITKPFNIEQLTMVVKMALENRAHRLKNQQS
ncbi:sigma-54-dependent Fis family transcriptional regulator [Candidatus Aerophobetes bacterium]|uniref:Sigma-54-dependent Fis family transcriptional regulator n=1 Tax=Aerophobetes bacterium TaxID=2030807 RepID=A0A523RWM9_UNCAE|nr:MAG: sigma-54-dependent Fis family transcriptional regulator [Candidatus Aerophobetes bacterium]